MEHVSDQQQKIDQLVRNETYFAELEDSGPLRLWPQARNFLWGNEEVLTSLETQEESEAHQVKVEEDFRMEVKEGVEAEDDETTPATRPVLEIPSVMAELLNLESSHILVRSEYEEAKRAALVANVNNFRAFLICGQVGIGKTFFLIWLLMQRLALRLPTALQLRDDHAILFHSGGTFRFLDVANTEAYMDLQSSNHSDRIWALVDSSQVLSKPAPIFRTGNPFFVIEAASRESRFEWASRVHRQYFYMGTWAFSEVLQARPFMGLLYGGPHEESQLRHLYDVYRAPPRALARYARIPDEYGDLVAQKVQQITPGDLRSVFHNPDPDDSSHLIVRIEPSPTKRTRFEKTFASRRVFELLCDRHLRDSVADMKHFYYVSQDSSVTAPAAGWIFELRMHQLFRQGYLLKILPLGRGEAKNKEFDDVYDNYATFHKEEGPKYFDLAVSQEHRLDEGSQLQVDRYYRPKADSFPTIDSLLLVHPTGEQSPILLMFQITCRKGCGIKEVSLEKIERLKFPLDTRKYYVAVTPASIVPEITVPKGRFADVGVFRHPVDENKLFLPA